MSKYISAIGDKGTDGTAVIRGRRRFNWGNNGNIGKAGRFGADDALRKTS